MLENEGLTTAEENDKLLSVSVVSVMMFTSSVSCVQKSSVNDLFVSMSANRCVVLTYLI